MKKLQKFLKKYSSLEFVNIEDIVKSFWITIDYLSFEKINWIIIWNRIWINKNISKAKQRFTMAHELAHFLLKEKWVSSGMFACKDLREKRADEFAMKLLLPKRALLEVYYEHHNLPTIAEVFQVPCEVVEKRLNKLLNK